MTSPILKLAVLLVLLTVPTYSYTVVNGQTVLVNPQTREIVEIIE
jgi:Protein of unknown function (DUF1236)